MDLTDPPNSPRTLSKSSWDPEYLCLHCDTRKWRIGGASTLGLHLAIHPVGAQVFPSFERVDAEGYILSFDECRVKIGRQPVKAGTNLDGWVRSRSGSSWLTDDRNNPRPERKKNRR